MAGTKGGVVHRDAFMPGVTGSAIGRQINTAVGRDLMAAPECLWGLPLPFPVRQQAPIGAITRRRWLLF